MKIPQYVSTAAGDMRLIPANVMVLFVPASGIDKSSGITDGLRLGTSVSGLALGIPVGLLDGDDDGPTEGFRLGASVSGLAEGLDVGLRVGLSVTGLLVGLSDGGAEGLRAANV